MKKVNFKTRLMAAAIAVFALTSCGGGNSNQQSGNATEIKTEAKAEQVTTIPKEDVALLSWQTVEEKEAVFAEIPAALLKTVGKLSFCQVMKNNSDEYKYTLLINSSTKTEEDMKVGIKALADYYRSVGATVEATNETFSNYNVKFDNAKSVKIDAFGKYIQIQFSVVKK
jgi:hypothetical protein